MKFHGINDAESILVETGATAASQTSVATATGQRLVYRFYTHFHPYVGRLVREMLSAGASVRALQEADTSFKPGKPSSETEKPKPEDYKLFEKFFNIPDGPYGPDPDRVPDAEGAPHPVKDLDFTASGAYAIYNWELFFHIPLTIALHLSKNQRYQEAQQWFHYIFDPTDDSRGSTPERFWRVKPFQTTDVERIEEILVNLATGEDFQLQQDTLSSIDQWKDAPFRPHRVARFRPTAYMLKTIMSYLDNLIAWGDALFREDTGESINEATQLYLLAANILGARPQAVPRPTAVAPQTYAGLHRDWDHFGNVLVELESALPLDDTSVPSEAADDARLSVLRSLGRTLYFCVPRNDRLLGYWDTVADRLFKIRNSLNLQGVFRQLPLFEPPIDPALLAKAAAAGVDVAAALIGIGQPLPLVRFVFLVQKAAEICQEVQSLGNSLLSAIEKQDNEALALLRARHERAILGLTEIVRYQQWQEARKSLEALEQTLAGATARYIHYERLLGRNPRDIALPEIGALDLESLERGSYRQAEPSVGKRPISVSCVQGLDESIPAYLVLSPHEFQELVKLKAAVAQQLSAATMDLIGSGLSLIPQFEVNVQPVGIGASTDFGGEQLSKIMAMVASAQRIGAEMLTYDANKAGKLAGYDRRQQEWAFQSNSAAHEIGQLYKQIRAAQIRAAMAEREWTNHQQQVRFAEEVEQFLAGEKTQAGAEQHSKTSTQAFYAWMRREVKGLYGQVFQFAFDVARKAERALRQELGDPNLSFLQFGYLSGQEGLLAGERLYLDIRRMEMAYHDLHAREYELTKHVSLLQVDPLALVRLRATGSCTVSLPEELFDMDGPGHYFRRIKAVAVSIPCVAGPYASVNCRLTLLNSRIRKTPEVGRDGYAWRGEEDPHFDYYSGSTQAIVTSSAQNDSGLFETNLHDERYLPFENSGVISTWQLQLPANPSLQELTQLDYQTISDVILHIRYTAREGGELLRNGAITRLNERIVDGQAAGSVRLFSVRHEFPTEWARFQGQTPAPGQRFELALNFRPEHYPFWSQGRLNGVRRVNCLARSTMDPVPGFMDIFANSEGEDKKGTLLTDSSMGNLLVGELTGIANPVGEVTLFFDNQATSDLWIAVTWNMQA